MPYADPLRKKAADKEYAERNREQIAKYQREYRSKHRERHNELNKRSRSRTFMRRRERHLYRLYGLTLADYDALLIRQGGGCAICGCTPHAKHLHVDHDHKTGLVRGIVCWPCNYRIGAVDSKYYPRILAYLGIS